MKIEMTEDQAERIFRALERETLTWLSRMRIMRPEARAQRLYALMEDQELMVTLECEIDDARAARNVSSLAAEAAQQRAIAARERRMEAVDRKIARKEARYAKGAKEAYVADVMRALNAED